MNTLAKVAYLSGVADGLKIALTAVLQKGKPCEGVNAVLFESVIPQHMLQTDTVKAVDKFYEQPENLLIPVTKVLNIVSARARGVSEDQIRQWTSEDRRAANEAPERKGEQ
jgi:hypothetical protein